MVCELAKQNKKEQESLVYPKVQLQKEIVIGRLKEQGYRITKQRLILLDIILEEKCTCCKEIYYQASKLDSKIGAATVYRMVNTLEQIGAIHRENMYKIACNSKCEAQETYAIKLNDTTTYHLSAKAWNVIIVAGLKACGYLMNEQTIQNIVVWTENNRDILSDHY